jgi:hypothetical protein
MSLSSVDQLGSMLGSSMRGQEDIKNQISPNEGESQIFIASSNRIRHKHNVVKITARDVSTDAIWDFVEWDTPPAYWEGEYDEEPELLYVLNPLGSFKDIFDNEDFIDTTNTTASITTNSITFSTSGSELLQSEIIRYNPDTTYTEARVSLTGTNTEDARVYVSLDDGDNYTQITGTGWNTIPNTGYEVMYKVDNGETPSEIELTSIEVATR